MSAAKRRVIKVVDYEPQWPLTFDGLKQAIEGAMGDLAPAVEQVGSTSVPDLGAKPVIDLDVVIDSTALLNQAISSLATLGYHHRGDLGVTGREAFGREGSDVPRDGTGRTWPVHHLYVCAKDSDELARHVAFRDYLRVNLDDAAEYEAIKRRLARRYPNDIDAYIEGKRPFIEEILRRVGTKPTL